MISRKINCDFKLIYYGMYIWKAEINPQKQLVDNCLTNFTTEWKYSYYNLRNKYYWNNFVIIIFFGQIQLITVDKEGKHYFRNVFNRMMAVLSLNFSLAEVSCSWNKHILFIHNFMSLMNNLLSLWFVL